MTFHVAQRRALLPRPAKAALPLPDQGPRRGAPARRGAAHARVHHEGRLLVRPRRRRASTRATSSTARPTGASSTACGLDWYECESDVGMMGGTGAHEYMAPTPSGENDVALAPGLQRQRRDRQRRARRRSQLRARTLTGELETPGMTTIEDVAGHLGVHAGALLKAFPVVTESRGLRDGLRARRPPRQRDQARRTRSASRFRPAREDELPGRPAGLPRARRR